MILYKRNAKGQPIFWNIELLNNIITVTYGIVGKKSFNETINTNRNVLDEYNSLINNKRKEGYKELKDLYDNAPTNITDINVLINYLNTYLPVFNTHSDGSFIPMLCKTLEDNKPFTKNNYFGEWKINGERCIITAVKSDDLFNPIKLQYHSRQGIDWTDKLFYLDEILIPKIPNDFLDMMIWDGIALDGELYLPGYGINEINSFIKNTELPQHYQLQFWCYDIAIENMSAIRRYELLENNFGINKINFTSKEDHINNTERFILLPMTGVSNISDAILKRDNYIYLGFEGLVIRDSNAEYQFGGKRNSAMFKFKKILDGTFTIVNIVPEGVKRSNLPKFICMNDINDEVFECTLNAPHDYQEQILLNKDKYIGKYLHVEYRERSGIKQVPFHAKGIKILD